MKGIDQGTHELESQELLKHILRSTNLMQQFLRENKGIYEYTDFLDFLMDTVRNDAEIREQYQALGAYDEPFMVSVMECQGIFFVAANDFDNIEFFLNLEPAIDAAKYLAEHYQ